MYQKPDYAQTDIYDFILPFGGHLDENNRWVILRRSIDWKIIHEVYEKNFDNNNTGNVALSAKIAFGSLYIQRKLSLTDRELVDQISENPYMQYFIGFKEERGNYKQYFTKHHFTTLKVNSLPPNQLL